MSSQALIKRARQVLKIEAEAVLSQTSHVNADFAKIVEAFHEIGENGGHIAVMGIGKSGLIAQKIAATLSSTGTPAIFVHPSEGLHGDLGMIGPLDAILALSASGETEEIKKILPMLRERKLLLAAMTAQNSSRLARTADFVISSSVRKEACPLNLTPTASSTAMLALGDALAIALMEKKGFKPSDFARLHPGGSLGKKLAFRVSDLMRKGKENPVVKENCTVRQALLEMTRTRLGATHVIDSKGRLAGFFTDGDLRRNLQTDPQILNRKIAKVMTKNPCTVRPEDSAGRAWNLLREHHCDNLPVVEGSGRPVGIIDERDLLAEGIA